MRKRVIICDDDACAAAALREMVTSWMKQKNLDVDFRLYQSCEAFMQDTQAYDILFMDVFMSGKNGIAAVRETGAAASHPVVFVTSSRDFAVEAFELHAAHYLVKPLSAQVVAEALARCLPEAEIVHALQVKLGRDTVSIPQDRIQYIEVNNKVSILHMFSGNVETYASLDSLFAQMDNGMFMKAQRSFVVNMAYIESFLSDRLVLQNGEQVMLSRGNRAMLKLQYQRYMFQLARR